MLSSMTTTFVNAAVALLIIAAGAFAAGVPVTTPSGWFMLAALATAPAVILMHYRKPAAPTTSKSVQSEIR
jgi:hypothetical protein